MRRLLPRLTAKSLRLAARPVSPVCLSLSHYARAPADSCACPASVYAYKDLMKLTLEYAELTRPIISLPFALGMVQGAVLERLPENLFTVTRSQVNL